MSKVVAVPLVTVAEVIVVLDRLFFNVLGGKNGVYKLVFDTASSFGETD